MRNAGTLQASASQWILFQAQPLQEWVSQDWSWLTVRLSAFVAHSLIPPGRGGGGPFFVFPKYPIFQLSQQLSHWLVGWLFNMSASLHKTGFFENRGLFLLNSWSQSTSELWTFDEIIPRKRYTFQWGSRSFKWMNALLTLGGALVQLFC